MAIEFKAPLSELEKDRMKKSIKDVSSLMEKASILMENEIKLLEGKDVGEPDMHGMVFLIASYTKVQETLGELMGVLLPGSKKKE